MEQTVAGIKSAIASDFYRIGDRVPSVGEFTRRFNVSEKVPRTAYARLVAEGWLKARHGVGFFAASPDVRVWKGRVLYVQFCIGYYQMSVCAHVQRYLSDMGYRSVSVVLEDASRRSLEALEAALEDRYDIVFAECPRPEYEELFERSGMPYVVTHGGFSVPCSPGPGCRGVIIVDKSHLNDMAAAVRKSGARSVAIVSVSDSEAEYTAALRGAGCDVKLWRTPILGSGAGADGFRRGAQSFFSEKLSSGARLPDLLVFRDDYIAEGALYEMAKAGVDIPGDVKVIVLYNKGFGLTCPLDFARVEVDHDLIARDISSFLVACMERRRPSKVPKKTVQFVAGATL